ncbi:microphthalmia-associated transcription factor isoform X2 [Neocloeon triangulifer]|uniref:microphthalmia-associated transcription factor isoform X2 n=1 Tax=Neocloeon triangulifer TaxID=2078957 RepID=UPI00286EC704|nr:microphthalmia-associated transcription factor isoform X2 [Neocloeon triangulifer]
MDESGIDLGFDLNALDTESFWDLESRLDEGIFYELKSKTVPDESPPTFKTSTTTSRTQLKQQLMREQLQEQDRKEAVRKPGSVVAAAVTPAAPINTPLPAPFAATPVELPAQVLQVRTVLENPTRYHVIQKQKSQVRQYLSESFQGGGSLDSGGTPPARTTRAKRLAASSAPAVAVAHSRRTSTVAPNCAPQQADRVMSPGLSSVATSVSEGEELMDDWLSLGEASLPSDNQLKNEIDPQAFVEALGAGSGGGTGLYGQYQTFSEVFGAATATTSSSSSCPPDLPQIKVESGQICDNEVHAIIRDRQKKDNHNMIERRRRFNINDRIKELGTLLPKNNDPYFEVIRDARPNKGTILKSSVDFIKCLKQENERLKQIEEINKQTEQKNRRLLIRIRELEMQAKQHGLLAPEADWQNPEPLPSMSNNYIKMEDGRSLITLSNAVPQQIQMPDVVTEAATLSATQMEDLMEDDLHPVNGDPMLSSPNVSSPVHSLIEDIDMMV